MYVKSWKKYAPLGEKNNFFNCLNICKLAVISTETINNTVKPVLVAISIKQATCIKRSVFRFPIMTNKM